MTPFKNRCGDCGNFPGNGLVCRQDTIVRRRVVYELDYNCDNFTRWRKM